MGLGAHHESEIRLEVAHLDVSSRLLALTFLSLLPGDRNELTRKTTAQHENSSQDIYVSSRD